MRDILFRGRAVGSLKWVEGYLFKIWDKAYILWGTTNDLPNMIEVIPATLGQYTGLTDKNGTRIYESDIINGYYSNGEKYIENSVVEWSNLFIAWNVNKHVSLFGQGHCYYEVIGNIHDNPELLKGETNA